MDIEEFKTRIRQHYTYLGMAVKTIQNPKTRKCRKAQSDQISVVQGFSGSTVLLTGATGYVGALILEQLFRTCPDVKKVILFIRDIKNRQGKLVSAKERLRTQLKGPEFCALHSDLESILSKCDIMNADLNKPMLGIEEWQRTRLINEVDYIIHCAASIKFDEPIHQIMRTNYSATEDLLKLASEMRYLKCFSHMSTAYVNSNQPKHSSLREEIYPLPGCTNPLAAATELRNLPPKQAQKKAEKLMKKWGLINTYFVAKTLTERLVMSFDGKPFPVCILRPSLIGAVANHPHPGYIGNSSGFTAMVLGCLAGIITFIQHKPDHRIAVVPGDVVSSATLAATIAVAQKPDSGVLADDVSRIVHICTSDSYPLANRSIHTAIGAYVMTDPVVDSHKTLVKKGEYEFSWIKHKTTFKLRCFARACKLKAMCCIIRMHKGGARLANKIMMAHGMWSKLGASTHDFDFTFETPTCELLYDLLPTAEQDLIKPVWREDLGDSWVKYLRTYTAGTKHIFLKEAPTITDLQDYRVLDRCL